MDIRKIAVSEEPVERLLEVILDNRALITVSQSPPDLLKSAHRLFDQGVDLLGRIGYSRKFSDISCSRVHENKVRCKLVKFRIAENGILIVFVIFRFEKLGLDAVV